MYAQIPSSSKEAKLGNATGRRYHLTDRNLSLCLVTKVSLACFLRSPGASVTLLGEGQDFQEIRQTHASSPASTGQFCEMKPLQIFKLALTSHNSSSWATQQPMKSPSSRSTLEIPLDAVATRGCQEDSGELLKPELSGYAKSFTHITVVIPSSSGR